MGKLYVRACYASTHERIIAAKVLLFINICKFFLKKNIFAAKKRILGGDKEGNRQNRKPRGARRTRRTRRPRNPRGPRSPREPRKPR